MDSERAAPSPKVFVSYRREDTAGHAGRLFDAISARFGDDHVFMDVDLQPGVDFVSRIEETIGSSAVLLVIIGPKWATVTKAGEGQPRLSDARDYVRLEVETALARPDVKVIPVLVGGAQMPVAEALPESLQPLRRRNALELSDARWRYDVGRLVNSLAEVLGEPQPLPARGGTASHRGWLIGVGVGAVALVIVVLAVAGVFSGGGGGGGGGGIDTTAVTGGGSGQSLPASAKAEDLAKKYEALYETKDLSGLRKIMSADIVLKRGATFERRGAKDVIAEYKKEFDEIGNGQPNFDWQFGGSDRNQEIEEVHGTYSVGANGVPNQTGNFGLLAQIIGNQLYVKELCFDCPDLHHTGGFISS